MSTYCHNCGNKVNPNNSNLYTCNYCDKSYKVTKLEKHDVTSTMGHLLAVSYALSIIFILLSSGLSEMMGMTTLTTLTVVFAFLFFTFGVEEKVAESPLGGFGGVAFAVSVLATIALPCYFAFAFLPLLGSWNFLVGIVAGIIILAVILTGAYTLRLYLEYR